MATKKKTKAKKPKNTLRKIDVNKWTFDAIEERGLTPATLRKRYTEFRSIAEKRRKALIAKGYDKVPEVQEAFFPTLKEIKMTTPDPEMYVKLKMKQLVDYLNNPLTLLSNQENRAELKAMQTLREHGRDFAADRYTSFYKFMEAVRARSLGLLEDSDRAVVFFETHWEKGMSLQDLANAFEEWENADRAIAIANIRELYYNVNDKMSEDQKKEAYDKYIEKILEMIPDVTKPEIQKTERFIENRRARNRDVGRPTDNNK